MEFDFVTLLVGVGIGLAIALHIGMSILTTLAKRLEEIHKQKNSPEMINGKSVVEATITEEKGVYYMWNKNNDFLAQGKTLEELHAHLEARFKDSVFRVEKIPDELKS